MIIRIASALAALAVGAGAQSLSEPSRLEAGGKWIDVEIGHAAPLVYDFDGDGVRDLLVGQFGQGRCRVYRNTGTNAGPKFDQFEWFQAGDETATVKAG